MKNKVSLLTKIILIVFTLISYTVPVSADGIKKGTLVAQIFWGEGCHPCEKMKSFLKEMNTKYIGLKTEDYEIYYNTKNKSKLEEILKRNNKEFTGVPVVIIQENVFNGYSADKEKMIETILAERLNLQPQKLSKKSDIHTNTKDENKNDNLTINKDSSELGNINKAQRQNDERLGGLSEINEDAITPIKNIQKPQKSQADTVPMFGNINPLKIPLPIATVLIALIDSFNPCAAFVLLSLLGLLIHAQSKAKVLLAGGIFVFFSGVIYFLFMAAWLNLFFVVGNIRIIIILAGAVSLTVAVINIKDYFMFKKGISLTVSQENTQKLFERMRKLTRISSWTGIALSAGVLALAANAYEVLCSAGFPMVFTRILTLNNLTNLQYYLYLVLYNLVYVLPLTIIVVIFSVSLRKVKMQEIHGRILKLISGLMMFGLGAILLLDPVLLENILIIVGLVISAIAVGILLGYLEMRGKGAVKK